MKDTAAPAGDVSFDDLPDKGSSSDEISFDDLPDTEKNPWTDVGTVAPLDPLRAAGAGMTEIAIAAEGLAGLTLAKGYDEFKGLLTGKTETGAQDVVGGVMKSTSERLDSLKQQGTGLLGTATYQIPKMVTQMATAGLAGAAAVPAEFAGLSAEAQLATKMVSTATTATAFAAPATVAGSLEQAREGVPMKDIAKRAAIEGPLNLAFGMAPELKLGAGMAGRAAGRAVVGEAIGPTQAGLENLAFSGEPEKQQPLFTPEGVITGAVPLLIGGAHDLASRPAAGEAATAPADPNAVPDLTRSDLPGGEPPAGGEPSPAGAPPAEPTIRPETTAKLESLQKARDKVESPEAQKLLDDEAKAVQQDELKHQRAEAQRKANAPKAEQLRKDAEALGPEHNDLRKELLAKAEKLSPAKPPETPGIEVGEVKPGEEVTLKTAPEAPAAPAEAVPTAGIEVGTEKTPPAEPVSTEGLEVSSTTANALAGTQTPAKASAMGLRVGEPDVEHVDMPHVLSDPNIDLTALRHVADSHEVPMDGPHMDAVSDTAEALRLNPGDTVQAESDHRNDPEAFHARVKEIVNAAKQSKPIEAQSQASEPAAGGQLDQSKTESRPASGEPAVAAKPAEQVQPVKTDLEIAQESNESMRARMPKEGYPEAMAAANAERRAAADRVAADLKPGDMVGGMEIEVVLTRGGAQVKGNSGIVNIAAEIIGGEKIIKGKHPVTTKRQAAPAGVKDDLSGMPLDKLKSYARGWGLKDVSNRSHESLATEIRQKRGGAARAEDSNASAKRADLGAPNLSEGDQSWRATQTNVKRGEAVSILKKEFGNVGVQNALDRGLLHVIDDYEDLPAHLQHQAKEAGGVTAYYDPKTKAAYLLSNRLSKEQLPGVLIHELGEHYAMPDYLGEKGYANFLNEVKQAAHRNDGVARKAWNDTVRDYPHLDEGSRNFLREVAARIAEENPDHSLWRTVVAKAKAFLYRQGFRGKLSDADVAAMVKNALTRELKREPTDQQMSENGDAMAQRRQQETPESKAIKGFFAGGAAAKIINESEAQSGPYDGGCLICAKAIIQAMGGGELVRIASKAHGGQTEHYGALVEGTVYDAEGAHSTPNAWVRDFAKREGIENRSPTFSKGYDEKSDIPDDPRAVKQLASGLGTALDGDVMAQRKENAVKYADGKPDPLAQRRKPPSDRSRDEGSGADNGRDGRGSGEKVRSEPGKPGQLRVSGAHFSAVSRPVLDGRQYGTGLKGAEARRLASSDDPRIKARVYFYVDTGRGITPEQGVGNASHDLNIGNLYDLQNDPADFRAKVRAEMAKQKVVGNDAAMNIYESQLLDAGYAGYYNSDAFEHQGAAVILGKESHAVKPEKAMGRRREMDDEERAAPTPDDPQSVRSAASNIGAALDNPKLAQKIIRGVAREAFSEFSRLTGSMKRATASLTKMFDKDIGLGKTEEIYKAADQAETGQEVTDRKYAPFFEMAQKAFKQRYDAIVATGKELAYIQDYLPHMVQNPAEAATFFRDMLAKRPLEGRKGFSKERIHPTIKALRSFKVFDENGVPEYFDTEKQARDAAGPDGKVYKPLQLISDNPVDWTLASLAQMDKYLTHVKIRAAIEQHGWLMDIPEKGFIPAGLSRVNDASFAGKLVPTAIAKDLNNHLAPSLHQTLKGFSAFRFVQNAITTARLNLSAYHGLMVTLDALNNGLTVGFSRFLRGDLVGGVGDIVGAPLRAGMGILHGASGGLIKYRGSDLKDAWFGGKDVDPQTQAILHYMQLGGTKGLMESTEYHNKFEAIARAVDQHRWGAAAGNLAWAPFEAIGHLIHAHFVPSMKFAAREILVRNDLDRLGKLAGTGKDYAATMKVIDADTLRQIASRAVDNVDQRLGQLNYDNLFINRTAKEGFQTAFTSFGWQMGSIGTVLGAIKDTVHLTKPEELVKPIRNAKTGEVTSTHMPKVTQRLGYLLTLNALGMALNVGISYALTGQGPQDIRDVFTIRTGKKNDDGTDERLIIPSYLRDEWGLAHHPIQMVLDKLHPMFSDISSVVKNADYFGNQIWTPGAGPAQQGKEVGEYLLKSSLPYTMSSVDRMQKSGATGAKAALPYVGINPAPGYLSKDDFQQYVHDRYAETIPASVKTVEKTAHYQMFSDAKAELEAGGDPDLSMFSAKEQQKLFAESGVDPFEKKFSKLGMSEKLTAWEKATKEERDKYNLEEHIYQSMGLATPEQQERAIEMLSGKN